MILRRDEFTNLYGDTGSLICKEYPCTEHEWIAPVKYGFDAVGEHASMVAQVPYTLEYGVRGEIRTKERMKIEVFTGTTIHHVFKHYTSHTRYSDNGSLVAE